MKHAEIASSPAVKTNAKIKTKVFLLAQESAKKTKQWYEATDRLKR